MSMPFDLAFRVGLIPEGPNARKLGLVLLGAMDADGVAARDIDGLVKLSEEAGMTYSEFVEGAIALRDHGALGQDPDGSWYLMAMDLPDVEGAR